MQNFPNTASLHHHPQQIVYNSAGVSVSNAYRPYTQAPFFRTGPYVPGATHAYPVHPIPTQSVYQGNSHGLSARPNGQAHVNGYSTLYTLPRHQSSLRDLVPAQHVNSQPQFRTGTARRYDQMRQMYHTDKGFPGSGSIHQGQGYQPPPPPPPPGGFAEPYRVSAPRHYASVPHGVPRAVKRPRSEFYCESCTKGFDCEEDLDIHIAEDHVTCPHPGCGFSGREDVVRAHKLKHSINTDSKEEIDAWVAMRRFKFPRKPGSDPLVEEPKVVSKLERSIRSSIRQAKIDARKQRLAKDQKQPCIHWERTGKCKFGDTCSFGHEKQGVCTFFANHGRCRHGDACKYKHVKGSSRDLDELRNPHGGLLKKLLSVETSRWEGKILQVLRHAVNHNFYQDVRDSTNDRSEEEEKSHSEDSMSDEGSMYSEDEPFSPISNNS